MPFNVFYLQVPFIVASVFSHCNIHTVTFSWQQSSTWTLQTHLFSCSHSCQFMSFYFRVSIYSLYFFIFLCRIYSNRGQTHFSSVCDPYWNRNGTFGSYMSVLVLFIVYFDCRRGVLNHTSCSFVMYIVLYSGVVMNC